MLIIAALYLILLWLLFSRLKLARWGWFSGTIAVAIGGCRNWRAKARPTRKPCDRNMRRCPRLPATARTISLPPDMERDRLRLGMPGTATFFADNAGVIGLLMSILVWVSSYTAYL